MRWYRWFRYGGFWITFYVNYIKIDFYLCEDGINYSTNNKKCTNYEKINDKIWYNNYLKIELYYPDIKFQPTNKKNSIIVLYRQCFHHISKFNNKIDRLFLQRHILSDDHGWFYNRITNSSYWGYSSIEDDSYVTSNEKNLINEGSISRILPLNIYLESSVMI